MAKKRPTQPKRICGDCIHEYACSMWNRGNLHNTDATNCTNYETARMSAAYLIGKLDVLEELKRMDGERRNNEQNNG